MNTATVRCHRSAAQKGKALSFTKLIGATKSYFRTILLFSLALFFTQCSQGQNKITNRWVAAGELNKGKIVPTKKIREYEFLKNNKLNIYEEGNLTGSGTYTLAPNAKSVLIKNGNQSGSLGITKLTATELIMVFDRRDTVVFHPAGSAAAKQSQLKGASYDKFIIDWMALTNLYNNRSDMIASVVRNDQNSKERNEIFAKIDSTQKELRSFGSSWTNLSKERYKKYDDLQAKFTKEIDILVEFLHRNPDMPEAQSLKVRESARQGLEKEIEKARTQFIKTFNAYNGL